MVAVIVMELYESQLAQKVLRLRGIMSSFNLPEIEVFRSAPFHYRMRAEFRLWHEKDDLYHIVFDPETKQRLRVDQFPFAHKIINDTMQKMIKAIKPHPILRHKLFQIDYLSTMSGKIAVSLLYHRQLDVEWQNHAHFLREQLRSDGLDIQLIGRSAKRKICLDHDYVDERLVVQGKTMVYRQVENCFTQPNAAVNVSMLEWALDSTKSSENDLLELYCGNGNFSLVLARHFRQVLATEISKPSVVAAQFNIAANQIDNVQVVRMSARDFIQALQKVRQFNRLKKIDLAAYRFETILVDPPRSGLDDDTLKMAQTFPRILYISCNPKTLCSNLMVLSRTHRIRRLALFDQFPYTQHMECGALLEQI